MKSAIGFQARACFARLRLVGFHALFEFAVHLVQCGIALLNLRQHLIEPIDEFTDFAVRVFCGADRIVLLR